MHRNIYGSGLSQASGCHNPDKNHYNQYNGTYKETKPNPRDLWPAPGPFQPYNK